MRVLSAVFAAALLCVPAAWPAPQLSRDTLRRLIVMEDVEAASLVAEQVEWLAGGGMLVSGWQRWPDKPAFAAFDCPDVRLLPYQRARRPSGRGSCVALRAV